MTPADLLSKSTADIDYIRNHIALLEGALSRGDLIINAAHEFAISMAYVRISTILEAFHNDIITVLTEAIISASLPLKDLRRSLLGLALQSTITGANGTSLKGHRSRVKIFIDSESSDICAFQQHARPTDERTVKSDHYDTLWLVFGLPGSPLPSSTHIAVINEVAEYRNRLIHGRMPYKAFSRQKNAQDINDTLTRVDEVLLHVCTSVDFYLTHENYRR